MWVSEVQEWFVKCCCVSHHPIQSGTMTCVAVFVATLLVIAPSTASLAARRERRMAFNFDTNAGGKTVDWDNARAAPLLAQPPPSLPLPPSSLPLPPMRNDPLQALPDTNVNIPNPDNPSMSSSRTNTTSTANREDVNTFEDECPFDSNLCLFYDPCPPDKECTMNLACTDIVCVDKVQPTKNLHSQLPSSSTSENDTTVADVRICSNGSYIVCVHGHCGQNSSDCVCEPFWQGLKCDYPCSLPCVRGSCFLDIDGYVPPENITKEQMKCNCPFGWTGKLCNEKIPDLVEEAKRRTLVLGLSLGAVVVVIVLAFTLALMVMWRKRVIFVMKLIYFFKMEEDDDGRLYDAYISMGSSLQGLDFVKNVLCPKLENFGFKLFVQARDQLIGDAISASIIKAMAQSRRTILIITTEYLNNEWSKFECLIAQIEMLKLHQRIIPIVLDDISTEKEDMPNTLKHILESIKCLKFPKVLPNPTDSLKLSSLKTKKKEAKFWKRLELTMPKKRSPSSCTTVSLTNSKFSELEVKNGNPMVGNFTNIYSIV